jgi:hypothetical protein
MVIRVFQKTSKNIVTGCVEDDGKEKKEKWCDVCPSHSNCSVRQKWNFKTTKEKNNGR